ncbi:unnamed protein product, partial [Musa banksii]
MAAPFFSSPFQPYVYQLHRTDASFVAEGRIRRPSFHVQFPPQPLLSCATPSIVEGEDRSFLCPRRHRLQLPLPSSIASFVP